MPFLPMHLSHIKGMNYRPNSRCQTQPSDVVCNSFGGNSKQIGGRVGFFCSGAGERQEVCTCKQVGGVAMIGNGKLAPSIGSTLPQPCPAFQLWFHSKDTATTIFESSDS